MTATVTLGAHPDTGSALLGVRFRALPFFFGRGDFGRGDFDFGDLDREQLEELRRMMEEHFEQYRRSAPDPDTMPDSDQLEPHRAL